MVTLNTLLKKSTALCIFSIIFYFNNAIAHNVSATIKTEFCLVNSTAADIAISNVWSIDHADWSGEFLPGALLNQTVMPFSATCWPLTLVRRLLSDNQFNIQINTMSGLMSWTVKQYDAIGELHKKYETLTNDTNDYLLQEAGDNNGYATNVFVLEDDIKAQDDYLSHWMEHIPDHDTLKKYSTHRHA